MWKILLLSALCVGVLVAGSMPVTVYTLDVVMSLTEGYEFVFIPSFYLSQLTRFDLMQHPETMTVVKPYSYFGVESAYLNVNVTAFNVNGTLFLNSSVVLDTLAEHKLVFHRDYAGELYTRNITLKIDAYLLIKRTNETDVERSYHGEWSLELM